GPLPHHAHGARRAVGGGQPGAHRRPKGGLSRGGAPAAFGPPAAGHDQRAGPDPLQHRAAAGVCGGPPAGGPHACRHRGGRLGYPGGPAGEPGAVGHAPPADGGVLRQRHVGHRRPAGSCGGRRPGAGRALGRRLRRHALGPDRESPADHGGAAHARDGPRRRAAPDRIAAERRHAPPGRPRAALARGGFHGPGARVIFAPKPGGAGVPVFDYRFPYASQRSPVMGRRGAVATSHPLAAQIGLRILQEGGNAVDAAVATAAALTVLEPTSNGIGGDAFALVWDGKKLHGLNASGRAPMALSPEVFAAQGLTKVPTDGWLPVTVPGAVSAWVARTRRFGSMPLKRLLEPAARYAEEGHPVPPVIAGHWRAAAARFAGRDDWRQTFLPWGRPPEPGEIFACPDQARTLRLIGESDGEAFYRGELAAAIARYARETGGLITEADLAAHAPEWVEPIRTTYRGFDVWELPPNGQGLVALLALNILEDTELPSLPHLSAAQLHLVIEALKLAFADAHRYIADPALADVPTRELLSNV